MLTKIWDLIPLALFSILPSIGIGSYCLFKIGAWVESAMVATAALFGVAIIVLILVMDND